MATGRVYAVAGAKGGVGKTTTALNLGAALAAAGRSVVVVELDLAMANLADFLALDIDPETDTTVHDVLAGNAAVSEAVYDAPGGFSVVPSGTTLDGFAKTDVDGVGDVLLTLREQYEVVLLDTGAGLSHETLLPLALADETLLVSSPRVASVRDAEKTKQLTARVGGTVAGVVFVRSGTGNSPPVDRIADFLDVPMLGHVPEDESVPASQDAGRPVVTHAPDSEAAAAYVAIAGRLAGRETVEADRGRLVSNAVRVRQETARHRGGFVFPEGESAERADHDGLTEAESLGGGGLGGVAGDADNAGVAAGENVDGGSDGVVGDAGDDTAGDAGDGVDGDNDVAGDVDHETPVLGPRRPDETANSDDRGPDSSGPAAVAAVGVGVGDDEPADPAESADSTNAVETVQPTETTQPTESTNAAQPAQPTESTNAVETRQQPEDARTFRSRLGAVLQSVRQSF